MPELRINSGQNEVLSAVYLSSIMKFPRKDKLAREYCARARLDIFRSWCADTEKIKTISNNNELPLLAQDLEVVLNSSYADGHAKFLEMSKVRTRRGLFAGNVLFQYVTEMHKVSDASVTSAKINAFELIQQGNTKWSSAWWPDGKKDFGKKTWQEFKGVSHLWCATVRIHAHLAELSDKLERTVPTVQETIRDNLQDILSLAHWLFLEIRSRDDFFFNPHDTWIVPEEYPLIPIKQVFGFLSVK